MRSIISLALLSAIATAAGCGGGGSTSGEPTATRTDSPAPAASPGQSPPASPHEASTTTAEQPTTGPLLGLPAGWELARRADYTAKQAAGRVTITAKGQSPTAGYQVRLFQSPLEIWPPQWILGHRKPDGIVAQVITPFEATASFKTERKVATVVVHDAAGRRLVNVAQVEK